jgi:hypothetical protein
MTLRMRLLFYGFTLAVSAVLSACSATSPAFSAGALPAWLQERLAIYEAAGRQSPVIAVHAWTYKGQTVYEMLAGCCDRFNELYDASGRYLCAPGGGFTGMGDGKCPDAAAARRAAEGSVHRIWPANGGDVQ